MTAAVKQDGSQTLVGRRFGRYEVLTQLAKGGMATVFIGRAHGVAGFERLVAIKVLHANLAHEEDFVSMFLDEARLAARIHHPNVVSTIDISDTVGSGYYLVMEYVEGDHVGSILRNAVKQNQPLPSDVVARVVLDALEGLHAAHNLKNEDGSPQNLVHRDISPQNILVGTDGVARLTDFGVAKAEVRLSSTRDGTFKGKLSYMAPEQAGSGELDQRADLFSMGIVLWECLTGRRLFRGETNAETLNRVLSHEIASPSAFYPELAPFDPVIEQALARKLDERFQSALEFVDALEKAALQARGLAKHREVAAVVQRFAGEKVAEERARVRAATERGRAESGLSPDITGGFVAPISVRSGVKTINADGPSQTSTVAARPDKRMIPTADLDAEVEAMRGPSKLVIGGVVLAALLCLGLGFVAIRTLLAPGGEETSTTVPTEPPGAGTTHTTTTTARSTEMTTPVVAVEETPVVDPAPTLMTAPEATPTGMASDDEPGTTQQAGSSDRGTTAAQRARREERRRRREDRRARLDDQADTPPPPVVEMTPVMVTPMAPPPAMRPQPPSVDEDLLSNPYRR